MIGYNRKKKKPTSLQLERARICREFAAKATGGYLTPEQGLELVLALRVKTPKSMSREISRIGKICDVGNVKPPYAAIERLMASKGLLAAPPEKGVIEDEPSGDRSLLYVKRAADEGDPRNGTCPRCKDLWNEATGLKKDGFYVYCGACGWEKEWPALLPLGVTA